MRFDRIYKPTIEKAGFIAKRADDISKPTEIMVGIWESIQDASIILADLSEKNPNVFYELGLAHAIAKPVIMITPSMDNVPFDLQALRIIIFKTQTPGWDKDLRIKLPIRNWLMLVVSQKTESIGTPRN